MVSRHRRRSLTVLVSILILGSICYRSTKLLTNLNLNHSNETPESMHLILQRNKALNLNIKATMANANGSTLSSRQKMILRQKMVLSQNAGRRMKKVHTLEELQRGNIIVNQKQHSTNQKADGPFVSQLDYIYKRGAWDGAPIVVEKYKLIFFTTPKVGCTVFKQLFRRMAGLKDWKKDVDPGIPHDPKFNGLSYLYNYNVNDATEMLKSDEWTRAIFVRDPKERLLSAYLDKAVRNDGEYVARHCCTECGLKSSKLQGFLSVIQHCLDPHWMPQSNRMEKKFWTTVNFVGHIETAADDAKELLQQIGAWKGFGDTGWGISGKESIFQSLSMVKHSTQADTHLKEYFDTKTETLANEYYKDDYDRFGFENRNILVEERIV